MHVLILPSWYFEHDIGDLGGRNFHLLAKSLVQVNVDARILYAHFSPSNSFSKKHTYRVEDTVPTWRTSQWFPPKFSSLIIQRWIDTYADEVLKYISSEDRPDLIHAHSYAACMVAQEVKKRTQTPFIYTEHLSRFIDGTIPPRYKKFISHSAGAADRITCVSPGLKSKLELYVQGDIDVVPNFFDPEIFSYSPAVKKHKLFTWISVGEPSHVKGLDLLIKAFAKARQLLPKAEMQLIFIDFIKDKDKLVNLARSHGVNEWIKWTGLITQPQIADILRQSHALVSSSRIETFGTVMVEAQACGIPVVATKTDGATFILSSPAQGLLAEMDDIDSLANAMAEMYVHYHTYDPEAIVTAVESRFNKNIVIQQWKDLYTKTLS